MADPERGIWEGPNFKQVPEFLNSNLISLAYGLTSTKDQTFINKVALVSCYIGEYADFVPFSGALGAWPRLAPMDSPLKVMAPRPPVNPRQCRGVHPPISFSGMAAELLGGSR